MSNDETVGTNALAVSNMHLDGGAFVADFDAMAEAAKAYASKFDNLPMVTEDDRKSAKTMRAEINGKIGEIDRARIDLGAEYDAPKREFDRKCKGIMSILADQVKYIDEGLKRKDEEFRDRREALLLQEYETTAKELMPHIPLEAFTRREPKLLGRTWGDEKACKALTEMIVTAISDRETIKASCGDFHVEADMLYCQTLDLRAALDKHKQLVDERKRLEEHERMMRDVALVDDPAPEPPHESKPAQSGYPAPAKRRGEPVQDWRFDFRGTRSQAESLAKSAREIGVASDGIKPRRSQ